MKHGTHSIAALEKVSLHQIPSALQSVWSNPPSALFFPIHFFNREGNNCQLGAINAAEARHKLTHLPESERQRGGGRKEGDTASALARADRNSGTSVPFVRPHISSAAEVLSAIRVEKPLVQLGEI